MSSIADDKDNEKTEKEYDVTGSAKAEGSEGDVHEIEVEGTAKVTSLESKREAPTQEVTVELPGGVKMTYPVAAADLAEFQQASTKDAARETAKVASGAAQPAAFTRRGGID